MLDTIFLFTQTIAMQTVPVRVQSRPRVPLAVASSSCGYWASPILESISENPAPHSTADDVISIETARPIRELPPNERGRYELFAPIPVTYERYVGRPEVTARFLEAEISMTGIDEEDARYELLNAVLDVFDCLPNSAEEAAGTLSQKQHRVLNRHLRHS